MAAEFVIPRAVDRTAAGWAVVIRNQAVMWPGGVGVWIVPRTGEVFLIPAGSQFGQDMLTASCGTRDGIVGAYVGFYKAPVAMKTILDDLNAHGGFMFKRAA